MARPNDDWVKDKSLVPPDEMEKLRTFPMRLQRRFKVCLFVSCLIILTTQCAVLKLTTFFFKKNTDKLLALLMLLRPLQN